MTQRAPTPAREAADDMLAALEAWLAYDSDEADDGVAMMIAYDKALTLTKAAIAKAKGGDWVRATDYDALAAKLAEVDADRHDMSNRYYAEKARAEAAEAKLAYVKESGVEWQPIENAPKDALILGYENGMVRLVMWESGWVQVGATIERGWFDPTHWMPLPDATELIARIQTGEE